MPKGEFIKFLCESTFWALAIKEVNHIKRNKQLMFLLIFPPTIQLLLYGFTLNPDIHNLKLGIIDYANISASREFISALTENRIFVAEYFLKVLGKGFSKGTRMRYLTSNS